MKSSKKALGEERFGVIERRLVDIIANFGYLKGRSAKTTEVMAYIYIRQEVTQKLLRELTGYSLGTISAALQNLEKWGVVSKHPSPNARGYIYRLAGTLSQVLSRSMTGFQDYLSQTSGFLEEVELKLSKLSLSKKQGYSKLRRFLDEMNVLIPAYQHILQKFQTTPLAAGGERVGVASDH
jgi:DNA-binding transcriptional regulator GbsR (MarR family)